MKLAQSGIHQFANVKGEKPFHSGAALRIKPDRSRSVADLRGAGVGGLAPQPQVNPGSTTQGLSVSRIMNSHIFFTTDFSSGCPYKNIGLDESVLLQSSRLNGPTWMP